MSLNGSPSPYSRPDITVEAAVAAYKRTGSLRKASIELGCTRDLLNRRLAANKEQEVMPPPSGQIISGVSTLYDESGNQKLQWVKTKTEQEQILKVTIEQIKQEFEDIPKVKKIQPPKHKNNELLTVYPIGDQHHGMAAWGEEVGADWDIKISADSLAAAARHLVDISPPSGTAIIANVGDFFHYDNIKNETSRSGHTLDVDTRYAKMIRTGIAMLRMFINTALKKHVNVKLLNACGNHDDLGALWLSTALQLLYEQNPRVQVELSPSKFFYMQHGKVLIGVTHGDTVKLDKLGGVMATDRAKEWGESEFRYWFTGHIHQRKVIELPGVMVESFRTLAGRDAWSNAAGYRSGRDLTAIVLHREFGEVARHRFDISMLSHQESIS